MHFRQAILHTVTWKILNTIFVFCINLLMVRILGAEDSGRLFYDLALLSFFTLLFSWSLESGITYYGSNHPPNIRPITIFILPWLLLQALASWLLLLYIPLSVDPLAASAYLVANLGIVYFSAILYAQKRFNAVNLVTGIANLLLLALLCMIWFGDMIYGGLAIPIFIGSYVALAVALFIITMGVVRHIVPDPPVSSTLLKQVFRYSLVACAGNILFFLVIRVDYYFVERFCDDIALSNYVQVSKFGQLMVLLPSTLAMVVFPYSAGSQHKDYLSTVQSLCRIISLLFIPVALIIGLAGYWIFPWLLGPEFTEVYPAMLFYLPGFFSLSIVTVLAAHLAGKAMLKENIKATVAALFVVLAGGLLLIPRWGIYAAAAVSSAAYFLCMVVLLRTYITRFDCRLKDFFNIGKADMNALTGIFKK